jgi:hypothetical protein
MKDRQLEIQLIIEEQRSNFHVEKTWGLPQSADINFETDSVTFLDWYHGLRLRRQYQLVLVHHLFYGKEHHVHVLLIGHQTLKGLLHDYIVQENQFCPLTQIFLLPFNPNLPIGPKPSLGPVVLRSCGP